MNNSRIVSEPQPVHRRRRVLSIILLALLLELALYGIAHLAPAMAGLVRSVYIVVAVVALILLVQSLRRRENGDRRQEERREESAD